MHKSQFLLPRLAALLSGGFLCASALAQESTAAAAPPADTAASAPAGAPTALERVTITAQGGRKQELQNVPIAVQVMGQDELRKLGSVNLGELNSYVPGLSVSSSQATQPAFFLRGIGTGDFGIGTDAPVGIYVDGVYAGKTGGALLNFNDVKRVEVLKGPQGTLFGRNSAGGAISIISNDPQIGVNSASGLLRLGSFDKRQGELTLNRALGEDLALRFSAVSERGGGWLRDAATGARAYDKNAWGTRLALRWSGESTSVQLKWEHENLNQAANPTISVIATPPVGVLPTYPADPNAFVNPFQAPLLNDVKDATEARRFDGLTLKIEHSLPWADFSSTTAMRRFNSHNYTDNDGTNRIATYFSLTNAERNSSWQQEFRLAGNNKTVDWLAGASFYVERADQTSGLNTYTDSLDTLLGYVASIRPYETVNQLAAAVGLSDFNLLGLGWNERMINQGRYKAAAVYGDAIWHLSASSNLTTGLRYTRDDKRFSWYKPARTATGLDQQLAVLNDAQFFPGLVAAGVLSQADAEQLLQLMSTGFLINGTGATDAALQVQKAWSNISPRLVLDHRFGPNLMAYASATRGYQSGGFNALSVNSSYQPEYVESYELGAKGGWPQYGLSFNAALFSYRFDNLQNLTLQPASNGSLPSYQVTISNQKAWGLDFELRWQPMAGLNLFGNGEYIDQRYGSYSAKVDGQDVTLDGQPAGTPKLSLSAGIDYRWALQTGQASVSLQSSYSTATRCNPFNSSQFACLSTPNLRLGGPRSRADLRLGWDSAESRWGLALLVNNLLDKRYANGLDTISAPVGLYSTWVTPPRTYALEFHFKL